MRIPPRRGRHGAGVEEQTSDEQGNHRHGNAHLTSEFREGHRSGGRLLYHEARSPAPVFKETLPALCPARTEGSGRFVTFCSTSSPLGDAGRGHDFLEAGDVTTKAKKRRNGDQQHEG